ncbi:MAG TPA: ribose 5-phosphate isomerase B [Clostridiales bacterium]|nr:ribose 5-phosphate isomerase B [Clostridiales bacterium]
MKIAFGCDHGGFSLKADILSHLEKRGVEVVDCGTTSEQPADYAPFAKAVALKVQSGEADFGVLICGTGIGISIAANKISGIRCAHVHDTFSAHATREHNDANIVALGSRVVGPGLALDIIDIFLATDFSNEERHQRRIDQITQLEQERL